MKFRVVWRRENQPEETRVIDAPSRFSVYEEAEKERRTVISITEARGNALHALFSISFGSGVSMDERITFAKNLGAMLAAGLTLSRGLSVIERQSGKKRLKDIAHTLSEAVKKGAAFHEALKEHDKVFSNLFIAMARAGEESGSLAESLKTAGTQMERAHTLIKKVRGALIYPGIILAAIVIVGILMLMFVVPTLTNTFKELGVDLPLATQLIVSVSDFMTNNVLLVLMILVAVVALFIFVARSRAGGAALFRLVIRLPIVGVLVRETYTARAARALSSLLSSGVEVLSALQITHDVVGAQAFALVVKEAEARVRKGEPLSAAFADYPKLYPVLMADMIMVGEETGKVADMLRQVAEFYENDVEEKTKDLSTVIEPFLILLIGAVVGVFAVSMISPIYSISEKI